jgi:hypothetical protein
MAKSSDASPEKKSVPKKQIEGELDFVKLLNDEIARHLKSGRLNEDDVKQLGEIEEKFGAKKALDEMDRIVIDRIVADRREKLQSFTDQRFDDVGLA